MADPKIPGGGVLKATSAVSSDLDHVDSTLKSILKTVNALGPAADKASNSLAKAGKAGPGGGGRGGQSWGQTLDKVQDLSGNLSGGQRAGLALGLAAVAGAASMVPSTKNGVGLQQSLFYGGFASGNVSPGALNANSSMAQGALGNFQSGIGGAQAAQSTLAGFGFGQNTAAGRSMLGQVGAMSLTTGQSNQQVAATLGAQMTNPAQSNMLRMLGIETYGANGDVKDVAKISQQMLQKVFPGRKITPELVQTALRPGGTLSLMVSAYFPDPSMQTLVRDSMMKTAMNGGAYTPNNAASMDKLGLSNTSANPNAANMGYLSSESRKTNATRNGQVAGYAAGMAMGTGMNDSLTGMAEAIQPVTDGLMQLAATLETVNGTSGGQAIRNIAGIGLSLLGGGGKGGGAPTGKADVAGSGATSGGSVAWPTTSHGINTAYGVKGNWAAGHHTGVDIQAKDGDPVEAFEAGTVKGINTEGPAYGNHVLIDHGGGLTSLYAHLTSSKVQRGDKVSAGQVIGSAGHTGNVHPAGSAGAHLHFEIRQGGGYGHDVNPMPYLNGAASVANNAAPAGDPSGKPTDASKASTKSVGTPASTGASSPSGVNIWTDISGVHASASTLKGGLGAGGSLSLGQGETNVVGGSKTRGGSDGVGASSVSGGTPTLSSDSKYLSTLIKAGWRGSALQTAWEVMMAESGGKATNHNPNASTGDNSYGLFQINMLGDMGPARRKQYGLSSNEDLYNPDTNAHVAFLMSAGGKNWSPWSTYKNGAYTKYASQWQDLVKTSGLTGYSHGSYDVPKDQAANIHTGEMILEASVAKSVRENVAKGRAGQLGGTPPTVTIQVHLHGVSEGDARMLAGRVKDILENDATYASIGSS